MHLSHQGLCRLFAILVVIYMRPCTCQSLISAEDDQGGLYHIPMYHAPMLNDVERNNAFYKALSKVVTPSSIVVDLGAGSGLLSLMSAKLGAKKVFAIERKGFCETITKEIVGLNDLTDSIEVICDDARFITADDLTTTAGERPSILVSETLDSYLIGEGFVAMLFNWNFRGVIPDNTIVIPHHATLYMQLVQTHYHLNDTMTVHGFDFSPIDRLRPRTEVIAGPVDKRTHRNISDHFPLIQFNFAGGLKEQDFFHYEYVEVPITEDGVLSSAVFYFDLSLDEEEEIKINTFVGSSTHWNQMTYLFDWRKVVRRGDTARLQIGQLPERLVIVDADAQRLLRFNNIAGQKIDIFTSQEGESVCTVEEKNYIFSFEGGHDGFPEYNLWMGSVGQIFMFRFLDSGEVRSLVIPAAEETGQLELFVYDIQPSVQRPSSKKSSRPTRTPGG